MSLLLCALLAAPSAAGLAKRYAGAILTINKRHAAAPKGHPEAELARRLPKAARKALDRLLEMDGAPGVNASLVRCGEAALDLDRIADFERIRKRLLALGAKEEAAGLGIALSRPRFLLRGLGGLDRQYLERFAEILEAILAGYDELFGFKEWSKVPGKKLRIRIHLEERIAHPPHFAPQFPFHSEVDFPVANAKEFASPTPDGKFLFYGLCHELGHVIAMWGDPRHEEDHHAWAHYTGVLLVEHLSGKARLRKLRDVRWRSLTKERKRLRDQEPGTKSRDAVLALLIRLHDAIGPQAIGKAINRLDAQDRRLRVNRVRYYTFKQLRKALLATLKSPRKKKAVARLLG